MSLEERLGTQWAVWVGGIALALGGVFLVRYSIEAGLLGPGVRVILGALLAIALIATGEWARRSERLSGISGIPSAHIPSILTAAGTVVAYADVYVSYALYDFLNPGLAFILLGAVALATLAAALLHGPALAGLGLVGAYVTPMLVASEKPDFWSLYIYLAIVTAAAFTLARMRMWRWLALTAIVFSALWTFPGLDTQPVTAIGAHAFHVVVGFALAAAMIVSGLLFGPEAEPDQIDDVSSASLGAYLMAATFLVLASRHDPVALATFALLIAATVAIAWRTAAAAAAVPAAALLATLVMLRWALSLNSEYLIAPSGPVAGAVPDPELARTGWHLALGIGFAALFGVTGFLAQGRSERPTIPLLWSAAAVFTPLAHAGGALLSDRRVRAVDPVRGCRPAARGVVRVRDRGARQARPAPGPCGRRGDLRHRRSRRARAGAHHGAGERLAHGRARPDGAGHRLGAGEAAAAGVALAHRRHRRRWWWHASPGIRASWASTSAPRRSSTGCSTATAFRPRHSGSAVRCCAGADDDQPARMIEAGALLLTVLTVFLEIRHYINNGDIYYRSVRPDRGGAPGLRRARR